MSLIENLKEKNQIPQQTQMKAEFYTVQPETWITLFKWIEDTKDKIKNMEYKVNGRHSEYTKKGTYRNNKNTSGVQMMKYQEELKELQKIKWKNIFKGIPIGIVIGILVTVLWIH